MKIPIFDSNGHLSISGPCVENTLGVRMPYWWLEWSAKIDWALLLLATSGGYIPPHHVLDHALSSLDSSSSDAIYELAILNFEEHPDWKYEQRALEKIASCISEDEWESARRRLLYSAAYWSYVNRATYSGWHYEASFDLSIFWEDMGKPDLDDLFCEQPLRVNVSEYEDFIQNHWAECAPASSCKGIDVVRPWTPEDKRGEAVISRRLIAEPIAFLLAGGDPFLSQLRDQFHNSEIVEEWYTGVGYYIDLRVRDASLRIDGFKQDVIISDLQADVGDSLVGFVLYVNEGFITTLEAYSIDDKGWPPEGPFTNYLYHGKEGDSPDEEGRNWERLRRNWSLGEPPRPAISQASLIDAFIRGQDRDADEKPGDVTVLDWLEKGSGFSFGSFFLGPVYWVYRKRYWSALILGTIYFEGALLLALLMRSDVGLPLVGARLIQLPTFMVVACLFPKIYQACYSSVLRKGRKRNLQGADLLEYVAKRGGVNRPAAVLAFILFVGSIFFFATWLPGTILG